MKFLRELWLCGIFLLTVFSGFAQGFVENALLFSRTRAGGSARVQALGGAQVALGGDFSSALSNPAGLGMYNRSEATFSPGLNFYSTDAAHLGTMSKDSRTVFTIPGLSYVHHLPKDKNGFLGGSVGASLTRINDFNTRFNYHGTDNSSSIINSFEEYANGYSINELPSPYDNTPLLSYDLPEGLAYLTYLITPLSEDPGNTSPVMPDDYTTYFSELDTIGNETRTLDRSQKVTTRGSQYQLALAYGGNYKDKLFFGGSIGITMLRYEFSTSYNESNYKFSSNAGYNPLNGLRLNEDILIDGNGVNLTLGLIYRPINFAQVGISLVTPTYYELTDTYSARLRTNWNIRGDEDQSSEEIVSEYSMTTPLKFSTGAAVFLGKYGFITGDVEFVNYTKAKYESNTPDVSFSPENKEIKKYYTNVVNFRLGAEFRINIFRLRGGYNVQNNPYKRALDVNQKITTISGGVGIKYSKFFVDLAVLRSKWNTAYSQYALSNGEGPVANLKNTMTTGMITFGFTF